MDKTVFFRNIVIMTLSMLLLRILSMCFNVYISSLLGAELIGLYHLIFSAFAFGITFSVSGTSFAATRLISENRSPEKENTIVTQCILVSLVTATLAMVVINVFSPLISLNILNDVRCIIPLKILSFGLPFISVSAVLRGYMIAKGYIGSLTFSQIFEEIVSISVSLMLLFSFKGSKNSYIFILIGLTASELAAFFADFVIYRLKKEKSHKKSRIGYKSILTISVPVALGSYLRSGLSAAENILIPRRLELSGVTDSLAKYGVVKGMSMPVLLFPTVLISSASQLLMPVLAKKNSLNMPRGISYISSKAIEYTLIFAVGVAVCIFYYSDELAISLYNNYEAGVYMCYLAFLTIPLYLDSITDSMLKGLDRQVDSLKFNVIDSVIRVILIIYVLPRYSVLGYISILYISEIFNLALSFSCLANAIRVEANFLKCLIAPLALAILVGYLTNAYLDNFIFGMICFTIMYASFSSLLVKIVDFARNKNSCINICRKKQKTIV